MKPVFIALALTPLLAASAPAQPRESPVTQALADAQAQQAAAEAETARLERAAAQARGEAERLNAEQAAAAQAIEAAEAKITAADMRFRLASAFVAAHRRKLAQEQRPISSLLGGLAVMARRPPLLALASAGGGSDELVKVEILLDSTLPVIRKRTQAISGRISEAQRLEAAAAYARSGLARSREQLVQRRNRFAELERRAFERSVATGGRALGSGDAAIAAAEQVQRLQNQQSSGRADQALAALLASEQPAPSRPFTPEGAVQRLPFRYALPAAAPVIEGLGAVNDSGVRSRGVVLATRRGAGVAAPADGVVRFSGPFRSYDGILILDHGNGWLSLIVNLASPLKAGAKVRLGDPLGPALGAIEVQLSHNGQRFSPALIAGSSQTLSKGMKDG